jgi:hypothetical protein
MTPQFAQLLSALDHALGTVGSIFLWLAAISAILFIIALLCAAYLPPAKHRRRRSFTDMRYFAPLLLAGVVGMMAGCSTTQQATAVKNLSTAQSYVTKAQADLAIVQTTLPAITGTANATKANNYLSYIETALEGLQVAIPAAQAVVSASGTTP